MTNKFIADYMHLAEISYADFIQDYSDDAIFNILTKPKNEGGQELPESFAQYLTDRYEAAAHWKDRPIIALTGRGSSFSGTLFKSKADGQYVLALRGTEQIVDDILVTDIGDIVHDGLAHHQIVDLYNFWQQVNAEKDQPYTAAKIVSVGEAVGRELLDWFKNNPDQSGWIGQGYFVDSGEIKKIIFEQSDKVYGNGDERRYGLGIKPDTVTVTGHSLGGHLSAAFSRLFPNQAEHIQINRCTTIPDESHLYV